MSATDLKRAVDDLLAPLKELQRTAHREEEQALKQLDEARERRREIDKMLRVIDPEARPFHKNGGKKKRQTAKHSEETIDTIADWLVANAEKLNASNEGDGFFASQVMTDYGSALPLSSQSGLSTVFTRLHDRKVLRLAKTGGLGGRKYYKVVV